MTREFTKDNTGLVKGLAIMCMLFYHLFETYERVNMMGVDYRPFSLDVFMTISGFGNICVAVFAFLSAYGISKSLLGLNDSDIKIWYKYACKRYLKLLAGFLCIFASVNLLWFRKFDYISLYGNGWQGALKALIDALGLAQVFGTPTLCNTWWYMEIALIIIFITPLLLKATKRMGGYIIILGAIVPLIAELPYDFKRYYFVILFGVVAASEDWFEKLYDLKIHTVVRLVAGAILIALAVVIRQNYFVYNELTYLLDAPIALLFSWYGKELLERIPGIREAIRFIGRHSINIYFVHSFIYMIIFQEFVYSFRYAGLIFIVLLVACLAYSLVLEGIKYLIRNTMEKAHVGSVK